MLKIDIPVKSPSVPPSGEDHQQLPDFVFHNSPIVATSCAKFVLLLSRILCMELDSKTISKAPTDDFLIKYKFCANGTSGPIAALYKKEVGSK